MHDPIFLHLCVCVCVSVAGRVWRGVTGRDSPGRRICPHDPCTRVSPSVQSCFNYTGTSDNAKNNDTLDGVSDDNVHLVMMMI